MSNFLFEKGIFTPSIKPPSRRVKFGSQIHTSKHLSIFYIPAAALLFPKNLLKMPLIPLLLLCSTGIYSQIKFRSKLGTKYARGLWWSAGFL